MSDEESIKQKQNYLRTEIIEQKYNPGDFAEFLADEREHGDELDNWSIDSLKDAVERYKTLKVGQKEHDSSISEDESIQEAKEPEKEVPELDGKTEEKVEGKVDEAKSSSGSSSGDSSDSDSSSESEEDDTKKEKHKHKKHKHKNKDPLLTKSSSKDSNPKSPLKSNLVTKQDDKESEDVREKLLKKATRFKNSVTDFLKLEKCRKINTPNQLTDSTFRVVISNPRIVKGKLFSAKHVVYKVTTRPFNFECERRFSDFLWLRETLAKHYPSFYIPPIPPKDGKRSYDDFYIQNRMIFLQSFIDAVCEHRELRSAKFFLEFLQISSSSKWSSTKKILDKQSNLNSGFRDNVSKKLSGVDKLDLKAFSNLEGELKSRISDEIKEYSVALDELNRGLAPVNIRFEQLCKELLLNFDRLTSTIKNLASCAGRMESLHQTFNSRVQFGQTKTNEKLYESMKNTFYQWAEMTNSKVKMVEKHLVKTFHFSNMEIEAHNELIKARNQAGAEFFKRWVQLEGKKDKLYALGYSPDWQLDLNKHSVSKDVVVNNKDLSKYLMLPTETDSVKKIQEIFGYFNTQLIKESDHVFASRAKRFIHACTQLSQDSIEIFTDTSLLFKKFNHDVCNIYSMTLEIGNPKNKSEEEKTS